MEAVTMKILAGMDLARQSIAVCVLFESNSQRKRRFKISWSKKAWSEFVEKYGAENLLVAFEASPEAHRIKRVLDEFGVAYHCFHAADFETKKKKRKSDRIDAEKIARALRNDMLPPAVELPDEETAKLRSHLTGREAALKTLRRVTNRLDCLARERGVMMPAWRRSPEWFAEVRERFRASDRHLIEGEIIIGLATLQALEHHEEYIQQQVERADLADAVERLQTVPGVGPLTSVALAAYLGPDARRFSSARKVSDYLGLVPEMQQTGKSEVVLGHITKEGPPLLRRLLVQAAHTAVNGQQLERTCLQKWFDRLKYRRSRKIGIVALARRLATICYALLRDGETWKPEVLRPAKP
jgi:transposase